MQVGNWIVISIENHDTLKIPNPQKKQDHDIDFARQYDAAPRQSAAPWFWNPVYLSYTQIMPTHLCYKC